jgi:hypothetical protein
MCFSREEKISVLAKPEARQRRGCVAADTSHPVVVYAGAASTRRTVEAGTPRQLLIESLMQTESQS